MPQVIGVDVGGTFTDIVVFDGEAITGEKVPTTPDQSNGVAGAVVGDEEDVFLHGTTAATNTLLQERGARVALVTDAGYEDVIEIARQDRPSLYDSAVDRPRPLVDRSRRFGYDGDPKTLVGRVAESMPEAVAVGLIESYTEPGRERTLAQALRAALTVPIVESSVVSPEFREYERIATTVLSAYLTPSVADYLRSLDSRLPMATRLVMTSSGGLIPFAQGPASAGRLVLSGPAAGAVAAAALGSHHGHQTVLSFDMGGTSTDVSRITDGALAVGSGHRVADRVNRVPSVPIRSIGAGGGSIGWLDSGGALRVGPHSAGAVPGPASYGLGGVEPTITDANLVVGNIPAELALAGSVELDPTSARQSMSRLGDPAGLSVEATAQGMVEVVDSHMVHALRSVSVEEGADPRAAVLVAFGGAGGLHASRLARQLGMGTILIPPLAGVFSALGLLLASPRADVARTVMMADGNEGLDSVVRELSADANLRFETIFASSPRVMRSSSDVRYVGQSHEIEVETEPSWSAIRAGFETAHLRRFGFTRPDEPIEVVNLRATSTGHPPITWDDLPLIDLDRIPVGSDGVWHRDSLPPGFVVQGPAVITETNAAVLLGNEDRLEVLADGTLEIST